MLQFSGHLKGGSHLSQNGIAYLRVSTGRQAKSGLGIEAQRELVARHIDRSNGRLVLELVEAESGRNPARPILREALEACRLHRARLVVGTQSRLSRSRAEFFRLLDESGIAIEFADDPHGSSLSVGVKALVADEEARLISERTKAALAAAKRRGVKLGSARPGFWTAALHERRMDGLQKGREISLQRRISDATSFRARLLPVLHELRDSGLSYRQIVAELEKRNVPPRRAGRWTPSQVRIVLLSHSGSDLDTRVEEAAGQ